MNMFKAPKQNRKQQKAGSSLIQVSLLLIPKTKITLFSYHSGSGRIAIFLNYGKRQSLKKKKSKTRVLQSKMKREGKKKKKDDDGRRHQPQMKKNSSMAILNKLPCHRNYFD